jgi:Lrp/AsnC family leucine-responsive transcriptional regulator
MSEIVLDNIDLQILRALQENARLTTKELAAQVHLSTTPVFERMKRLEREGFILKYAAVLDAGKLGRGFTVFCSVKLKQMTRSVARNFISVIKDIPQVAECYNISGEYDYLLKIQASDMKYYNEFIINVLGNIDSIGSVLSSFVMDEIKNTHALYL